MAVLHYSATSSPAIPRIPLGPWCWADDGIEYAPSCRRDLASDMRNLRAA